MNPNFFVFVEAKHIVASRLIYKYIIVRLICFMRLLRLFFNVHRFNNRE